MFFVPIKVYFAGFLADVSRRVEEKLWDFNGFFKGKNQPNFFQEFPPPLPSPATVWIFLLLIFWIIYSGTKSPVRTQDRRQPQVPLTPSSSLRRIWYDQQKYLQRKNCVQFNSWGLILKIVKKNLLKNVYFTIFKTSKKIHKTSKLEKKSVFFWGGGEVGENWMCPCEASNPLVKKIGSVHFFLVLLHFSSFPNRPHLLAPVAPTTPPVISKAAAVPLNMLE